jgi:hypothetical protein
MDPRTKAVRERLCRYGLLSNEFSVRLHLGYIRVRFREEVPLERRLELAGIMAHEAQVVLRAGRELAGIVAVETPAYGQTGLYLETRGPCQPVSSVQEAQEQARAFHGQLQREEEERRRREQDRPQTPSLWDG